MAFYDTTWYVNFGDGSTTGYYAVTKRPQNAAVTAGQIVRQFTVPAAGSERCFICIVAGTTANTTDAGWTNTRGAKTTDGTATWIECTGASAVNGDLANTPTWATAKATGTPTQGAIIKRNSGASYQICTTAGTMAVSEPSFSDTAGVTTSDGTSVWTSLGVVGNFTGGQSPHGRINGVLTANWFASGNTVYVADNHTETLAAIYNISISSALMAKILCHNHSGSYPPTASDITTGASVASTSSGLSVIVQGSFYFYGITFKSIHNSMLIGGATVGSVQNWYYFDNCVFEVTSASGSTVGFALGGGSSGWNVIVFNNTKAKFFGTGQYIRPYFVNFTWQNTGSILSAGSSIPTTLFQQDNSSGRFNNITLNNLDLSQLTGSLFTNASNSSIGTLVVQDCKLNAAMTVTTPINTGMNVQLIRSDSGATSYKSTRYAYEGTETTETSIVRTGGSVDPTGQAQSRKIVTTTNSQWLRPFKAEPYAIWNPTTGANVTATVYGTVNAGALPNNDDIWLECEYLGSATDPLGKIVTTTKATVLSSNAAVASDSSVWSNLVIALDGAVTNPANLTLSNGNLTVAHITASPATVLSSGSWAAGKYYWELTCTSVSNSNVGDIFGMMRTGFSGCGFQPTAGNIRVDGTTVGTALGAFTAGNVACFAFDFTSGLMWVRKNGGSWNGSGTANPATGAGGMTIPAGDYYAGLSFASTAGGGANFTANFGASTYAFTAPSGFGNLSSVPFKLTITLSSPQPQLAGYLHVRVRAAKASTTYYIDPR